MGGKKPRDASPFCSVLPSDRISESMKDGSVHFLIHRFNFRDELIDNGQCLVVYNSCKLYQLFHTTFRSYYIQPVFEPYCALFKEMKREKEKQLSLQCLYKENKNTKKY